MIFPDVSLSKRTLISESDLKKISALSVPNNCLAIFKIPQKEQFSKNNFQNRD
jgi:RNA methyltransferase, TrmH family